MPCKEQGAKNKYLVALMKIVYFYHQGLYSRGGGVPAWRGNRLPLDGVKILYLLIGIGEDMPRIPRGGASSKNLTKPEKGWLDYWIRILKIVYCWLIYWKGLLPFQKGWLLPNWTSNVCLFPRNNRALAAKNSIRAQMYVHSTGFIWFHLC